MKQGFSLVELSIVLVILGLLTGGILAGQNLIRAAELRSVTTQYNAFSAAVQTFRDKYFALPGDMRNAEAFWGQAASGASCATTASTSTETCNGDGDGRVESTGGTANEIFRFWQHLANAGLVEGSYTGVTGSGGTNHGVTGMNVPRGRISNSGWFSYYHGAATNHFNRALENVIYVGGQTATGGTHDDIFTPEEAWNIDTKMDDGRPAYGNVTPMEFSPCTNAANRDDFAAEYALTRTSGSCFITFRGAW